MKNELIVEAIMQLCGSPLPEFVLRGDSLEGLDWLDATQEHPTNEEIEAKILEIKAKEVTDE